MCWIFEYIKRFHRLYWWKMPTYLIYLSYLTWHVNNFMHSLWRCHHLYIKPSSTVNNNVVLFRIFFNIFNQSNVAIEPISQQKNQLDVYFRMLKFECPQFWGKIIWAPSTNKHHIHGIWLWNDSCVLWCYSRHNRARHNQCVLC